MQIVSPYIYRLTYTHLFQKQICKYLELFKFVAGVICTPNIPVALHISVLKTTDSEKNEGRHSDSKGREKLQFL